MKGSHFFDRTRIGNKRTFAAQTKFQQHTIVDRSASRGPPRDPHRGAIPHFLVCSPLRTPAQGSLAVFFWSGIFLSAASYSRSTALLYSCVRGSTCFSPIRFTPGLILGACGCGASCAIA